MSGFQLYPHQVRAIEMLKASLRSGRRRPILALPTGSGKTIIAAEIIRGARCKGSRVVFAVPFVNLVDQTFDRFVSSGVDPGEIGVIQGDHAWRRPNAPFQIASIQTIARRGFPEASFVIVDEAHLRFKALDRWIGTRPDVLFIGLSASPWTKGLGEVWDDLVVPTSLRELIDLGWLSPFRVFAASKPDLSGVATVAGEYHEGQLSEVMSGKALVADVVSTWLEKGENRPTLLFAVNRAHAATLHEQFNAAGVPCAYVDGETPREERQAILARYAAGEFKIISSVGTMTTGVDVTCRCVIDAAPTKSDMRHCLDSETEILTSHGWKGMGDVRVGDCVASMTDMETGAGIWCNVTEVIERDMTESENWIQYTAPRANFRVTDNHRMIFRGAHERISGFRMATASEMQKCRGGAYLPAAISINQPGVPLTNHELYFLGIMMTDGTWSINGGSISQSERHPEIIERIEECLKGCGIGYAKSRVASPGDDAAIVERFPRWRFDFSMGKPRPHLNRIKPWRGKSRISEYFDGRTGFLHLAPYLDKDMAPALMGMSRDQFLVFLQGIFDGDGSKLKSPSVDWTPRTWLVVSARKTFADRVQALAAINGFMCNVRSENGPARKGKPIWAISVTPQPWRHVGGYTSKDRNPRPQIEVRPPTNERVWCVTTDVGTIVTRRRGKVTVVGNCQKIGRGLRTEPGKADCIVLDHAGNCLRLGLPTEIGRTTLRTGASDEREAKEGKAKSEPLPRECGSCGCLIPARVRKCDACGFEPKRRSEVETIDGELVEMGTAPKPKGKQTATERLAAQGKQAIWSQILGMAHQRNWKPGRAAHLYRGIFQVWPRGLDDTPRHPTPELLSYEHAKRIAFVKSKASDRKSEHATPDDGRALVDAA